MMIAFCALFVVVVCEWREVALSSQPLGRDLHGLCTDPSTGNVFLFGGEEDVKDDSPLRAAANNDALWRFDPCNESWAIVGANSPTPISVSSPSAFFRSVLTAAADQQ